MLALTLDAALARVSAAVLDDERVVAMDVRERDGSIRRKTGKLVACFPGLHHLQHHTESQDPTWCKTIPELGLLHIGKWIHRSPN